MYKTKFKQRSLNETITLLCKARGGEYLRAGKVNQSHLARLAGTNQANIFRWMNSEAKANDEHVRKLAKAFGVSPAQMRGEEPVNELDGTCQVLKQSDIDEKKRLSRLVDRFKPIWEANHKEKLTQELLAELLGEMRGKPISQSGICNYLSVNRATKLSVDFVHAFAALLGFDPGEVGERFKLKPYVVDLALQSLARDDDSAARILP